MSILFILGGLGFILWPVLQAIFRYDHDDLEERISQYIFDMNLEQHNQLQKIQEAGLFLILLGFFMLLVIP